MWLAGGDAINALLAHIEETYDALDEIRASSSASSSSDATSYMHAMEQFSFIYTAVICQYLLAFVRPLSAVLQAKNCNLVEVHKNAQEFIETLQAIRADEQKITVLYRRSVDFANKIGVEPQKPRSANRQRHRANAGAAEQSVEQYFKLNVFHPFLDHIITHLQNRFPTEIQNVMYASYLIPKRLRQMSPEIEATLLATFVDDMPSPTEFEQEMLRWKTKWSRMMVQDRPDTLIEAVEKCREEFFPNIAAILQLLLTLPIGSVACDRTFSSLQRLKTYCLVKMFYV